MVIASVFAMAAGTVTTVGLVALVAATARGWLSRAGAAGSPLGRRLAWPSASQPLPSSSSSAS